VKDDITHLINMSNYAFRTCIFNIITCMVVYKVALNVYYCFVAALDYFLLIKYKRHMSTMSTQLHFWLLVSLLVLLKAHKTSLTQSKLVYPILFFYWSPSTKTGKWVIMYLCGRDIDFSIGFWNVRTVWSILFFIWLINLRYRPAWFGSSAYVAITATPY
jgi:hypothetical protein